MPRGAVQRPTQVIGGVIHAQCLACGEWKNREAEFHRTGRAGQYHRSRCKDCLRHQHQEFDDDAERCREALARAERAPTITQVVNGKRIAERAAPFCLIPPTHAAYLPRVILALFVPNDRWPLAAD